MAYMPKQGGRGPPQILRAALQDAEKALNNYTAGKITYSELLTTQRKAGEIANGFNTRIFWLRHGAQLYGDFAGVLRYASFSPLFKA
jgi:hypothetical protein